MKWLSFAVTCVFISACGGGSNAPVTGSPAPTILDQSLVVMIGDSITCFWNDPHWQTDSGSLISAHLPHVIDVGIGGEVTQQMWTRLQSDVLDKHPGTIVIEGGTNDVGLLQSTDTQYLFDMVEAAQATGADVIVGNLPPDDYDYFGTYTVDELRFATWRTAILNGAVSYGYKVADYYPAMLTNEVQNGTLFWTDKVHPISAGYDVMWNVLEPLVRPVAKHGSPVIARVNSTTC